MLIKDWVGASAGASKEAAMVDEVKFVQQKKEAHL